jgi:hypothetical protein
MSHEAVCPSIVYWDERIAYYCDEKRRLLEEFGSAAEELISLHTQQLGAILGGDSDCNRFDLLIHMANERKLQAKYAYLRHVKAHDCFGATFAHYLDTEHNFCTPGSASPADSHLFVG